MKTLNMLQCSCGVWNWGKIKCDEHMWVSKAVEQKPWKNKTVFNIFMFLRCLWQGTFWVLLLIAGLFIVGLGIYIGCCIVGTF